MAEPQPDEKTSASNSADEFDDNPYRSPETSMPAIDTGGTDSPLVKNLRRRSGNDLIWCAVVASAFGYFIPFGVALDGVSLFLLIRTVTSGSRPSVWALVIGVLVGLWNILRIVATLLMLLVVAAA